MKSISPIFKIILFVSFIGGNSFLFFSQKPSEKQMVRKVRETKDENEKILRMIQLGEYFSIKNLKKAKDLQYRINTYSRQLNKKTALDVALYNALVYRLERNFELFYAVIQPYENSDLTGETVGKQQKILQNLGYHAIVTFQLKKADTLLQHALRLAELEKNNSEICRTCCYLSYNETQRKNKDLALKYIDQAFEAAKKSRLKSDWAMSYYFQSSIYDFFGQPDLALSKDLLAFTYAKGAQNYSLLPLISKKIGDKQVLIQNLNEALYYFESSYSYAKIYSDYRLQGMALASLSNVKRLQRKYQESFAYSKRAFAVFNASKSDGGIGFAELNLARIYIDKQSYSLAIKHLDLSLPHLEKSLNEDLKAEVYQLKGLIYKKRNEYTEALNYLNQFIDHQYSLGKPNKVFEIYPMIAEIYKLQGNNQKALHYLEEYVDFTEKNNKNLAARKIAELNELYRSKQRDELIDQQNNILEKQRRERELTKTKLENVSLRNNFQTYIIIAFVIIIILATIIGFYRNRQLVTQQKRREAEMSQILLRTQMNPHFIFNAMSVIQSYIFENDIKNSSKFLVNFSRLIRLILENSPKAFIHLETEIEILQKYLETQKLRFEDRFEFEIICPESLLFENVQIPPMITQPFVENSIEHGQLHTVQNGKITIEFGKKNNMLEIIIEDNGIGRLKSEALKKSKEHNSMAIDITRTRIQMINEKYNSAGYLNITDMDKQRQIGTKVIISIPYLNESANALSF